MVQCGKKARCIDAYQPVCLGSTERRRIERIIRCTGTKISETVRNGTFLHRGDPQALNGFAAVRHFIDQAENQLALTSGVGGTHDALHIVPLHESLQYGKLRLFVRRHNILPQLRQNRKIVHLPFGIGGVIGVCRRHFHQMSKAPAYEIAAALQIAVLPLPCAQHRSDALRDGRLLGYNEFHSCSLPKCCSMSSL